MAKGGWIDRHFNILKSVTYRSIEMVRGIIGGLRKFILRDGDLVIYLFIILIIFAGYYYFPDGFSGNNQAESKQTESKQNESQMADNITISGLTLATRYIGIVFTIFSLLFVAVQFRENYQWNERKAALEQAQRFREIVEPDIVILSKYFNYRDLGVNDSISVDEIHDMVCAKIKNSTILLRLPYGIDFNGPLDRKVNYEKENKQLEYYGLMRKNDKEKLLQLSDDTSYQQAVKTLFKLTNAELSDEEYILDREGDKLVTKERLEKLPGEVRNYVENEDPNISYNVAEKIITYKGRMKISKKDELLSKSTDKEWKIVVGKLFDKSPKMITDTKRGGYEIQKAIWNLLSAGEYLAVGMEHSVLDDSIIKDLYEDNICKIHSVFSAYITHYNYDMHETCEGRIWENFVALAVKYKSAREKKESQKV